MFAASISCLIDLIATASCAYPTLPQTRHIQPTRMTIHGAVVDSDGLAIPGVAVGVSDLV